MSPLFIAISAQVRAASLNRATAELERYAHRIQIRLERHSADNESGIYPEFLEELVCSGYLEALPPNPYYGPVKPGTVCCALDAGRMT